MKEKTWPTLYKKNSDGKSFQEWTIHAVEGDPDGPHAGKAVIFKVFGQVGGKLQTSDPTVVEGKNLGKSNETTPWEQALKEGESQWTKKQTGAKGYTPSMDDAAAGVRSELNTGACAPMLAKKYGVMANGEFEGKDNSKVVFPCFVQPKLNGNRMVATIVDGVVTLTSRDCKPIDTVPSLKAELERVFAGKTITLDGELYNHQLHEHLEDLRHMIAHDDERMQYHVYDIIGDGTFELRRGQLISLFGNGVLSSRIIEVPTHVATSHEDALWHFREARDAQYEGLMLRNAAGLYAQGKRSSDLQKLKGWLDREFLIVDVIEKGRGKDAGKAKFRCITGTGDPIPGVEFEVDIAASHERRAELFTQRDDLIGQWMTVRFAYYTQAGKPFHAQGQEIRPAEDANVT